MPFEPKKTVYSEAPTEDRYFTTHMEISLFLSSFVNTRNIYCLERSISISRSCVVQQRMEVAKRSTGESGAQLIVRAVALPSGISVGLI
jgi:hypothetical protein